MALQQPAHRQRRGPKLRHYIHHQPATPDDAVLSSSLASRRHRAESESAGGSVAHALGLPPGTPSAWATPQAAPAHCRLRIQGGFTVLDRQQRRLHDRAHTLGLTDLDSYLVARCQQDASLTQLAGELHTTIDVIRRLIDQAAIHRTPPKVRSARQRRRTTDQHLTIRAEHLGFASLRAYLVDRVARQRWQLTQVADELGIDRNL